MFLRQPIIANDYFMIITIIGPTINRSDASPKSKEQGQDPLQPQALPAGEPLHPQSPVLQAPAHHRGEGL